MSPTVVSDGHSWQQLLISISPALNISVLEFVSLLYCLYGSFAFFSVSSFSVSSRISTKKIRKRNKRPIDPGPSNNVRKFTGKSTFE